ncbi:MAG: hypothetical protein AAGG09_11170 [Pseudomonadota bacterium]
MPANFNGQKLDWNACAFFFVFCPNNSGTTVLSKYLARQLGAYLPPFGNSEGQMAPDVKAMMRLQPWSKKRKFDWLFIRHSWEALAEGRLFIEASPPNLMRFDQIAQVFGSDSSALVSICSPYQHVASCMRRYNKPGADLSAIADRWVPKAKQIRALREAYPHFPFLAHETFVQDATSLNRALSLEVRPFTEKGKKGSGGKGVQDLTVRTMSFLESQEIDELTKLLEPHAELLEFFGYSMADGQEMVASMRATSAEEFDRGRARRAAWNKGVESAQKAAT